MQCLHAGLRADPCNTHGCKPGATGSDLSCPQHQARDLGPCPATHPNAPAQPGRALGALELADAAIWRPHEEMEGTSFSARLGFQRCPQDQPSSGGQGWGNRPAPAGLQPGCPLQGQSQARRAAGSCFVYVACGTRGRSWGGWSRAQGPWTDLASPSAQLPPSPTCPVSRGESKDQRAPASAAGWMSTWARCSPKEQGHLKGAWPQEGHEAQSLAHRGDGEWGQSARIGAKSLEKKRVKQQMEVGGGRGGHRREQKAAGAHA